MKCAWVQDRLLPYLEGELDTREARKVVRHLEHCSRCIALTDDLADTQEKLQAAIRTDVEAPETLDARVMAVVRRLRPAGGQRHALPWPWGPRLRTAAAGLALALCGFAAGLRLSGMQHGGAAAALDLATLGGLHRSPQEGPPSDAGSPEPRAFARELSRTVRFAVTPVDLQPEGSQFVGGSSAAVHGVPVAHLQYRWKGQHVSLFEMDAKKLSPPVLERLASGGESYLAVKKDGVAYVAWTAQGKNCVLVAGGVPMHLLFQLACHACERMDRSTRQASRPPFPEGPKRPRERRLS